MSRELKAANISGWLFHVNIVLSILVFIAAYLTIQFGGGRSQLTFLAIVWALTLPVASAVLMATIDTQLGTLFGDESVPDDSPTTSLYIGGLGKDAAKAFMDFCAKNGLTMAKGFEYLMGKANL